MTKFMALVFLLLACYGCHYEELVTVKSIKLAPQEYVDKKIQLRTCFEGNREGAILVDCRENSFALAFVLSEQILDNKLLYDAFYNCVYRALPPKPEEDITVVLNGIYRVSKDATIGAFFEVNGVQEFCEDSSA